MRGFGCQPAVSDSASVVSLQLLIFHIYFLSPEIGNECLCAKCKSLEKLYSRWCRGGNSVMSIVFWMPLYLAMSQINFMSALQAPVTLADWYNDPHVLPLSIQSFNLPSPLVCRQFETLSEYMLSLLWLNIPQQALMALKVTGYNIALMYLWIDVNKFINCIHMSTLSNHNKILFSIL